MDTQHVCTPRSWMTFLICAAILATGLAPSPAAAGRNSYAMALAKSAKAEKMLEKGENEKAEELFRAGIEIEPDFPRPHLGLTAALVAQSRFEEALEALEAAKEKYVAWDQEAADLVLERRQEAFQATQEFETFAGTKSQSVSKVGQNVGHRLETQNLLQRDRWNLEEIQRIPSQAYYLQGIAHLRMGHHDEGIDALELCLALNEDHGLAHYNLAVALFGMGQAALAKEHLDAALNSGVEAHPQFVADLEASLQ